MRNTVFGYECKLENDDWSDIECSISELCDDYVVDRISRIHSDRTELNELLTQLKSGDTVIVNNLSDFGKNTKDVVKVLLDILGKGVKIVSVCECINSETDNGMLYKITKALSDVDAKFLHTRQKEGIEIAKSVGRYRGRPQKQLNDWDKIVRKVNNGEISIEMASNLLGVSRSTFYRRYKDAELNIRNNINDANKMLEEHENNIDVDSKKNTENEGITIKITKGTILNIVVS